MTGNGDGTFSYTYTPSDLVEHSILIKKFANQGISMYFLLPGSNEPALIQIESDINIDTPMEDFHLGCQSGCRVIYEFLLIAPITGKITLKMKTNGYASLYYSTEKVMTLSNREGTHEVTMEAGQLYYGSVDYFKPSNRYTVELTLSWEYPNQAEQIIPPSAFLHPSSINLSTNLTIN